MTVLIRLLPCRLWGRFQTFLRVTRHSENVVSGCLDVSVLRFLKNFRESPQQAFKRPLFGPSLLESFFPLPTLQRAAKSPRLISAAVCPQKNACPVRSLGKSGIFEACFAAACKWQRSATSLLAGLAKFHFRKPNERYALAPLLQVRSKP